MTKILYTKELKRFVQCFDMEDKHIKTVPKKFEKYINSGFVEDLSTKKLTPQERFSLEIEKFKDEIRKANRHVWQFIKDKKCTGARPVINFYGESRYEVIFDGRAQVRCTKRLYNLCPQKQENTTHLNY